MPAAGGGEAAAGSGDVFLTIPVTRPATLRLRRAAAEGAGTAGRRWMLRLPRSLCGVRTCWRMAGLAAAAFPRRLAGKQQICVPAASQELPRPRVMLQAVLELQMFFFSLRHLKRCLLASSAFPGCCFQAGIFQGNEF